jgi:GNAT superfamily N-acetyltransferase
MTQYNKAIVMIKELIWDSELIKRKIGRLTISSENLCSLKKGLKLAESEGFQYLLCKLTSQDTKVIRALESEGFYLTDIGVTFGINTAEFLARNKQRVLVKPPLPSSASRRLTREGISQISDLITPATQKDVPDLKKLIPSLFPESRFYHDPFFSRKEADNLYRAWIENSVNGREADIVFYIPRTGFITCKKTGKHSGKIVLIGIRKSSRGKGYGSALLFRAMEWFAGQGTDFVTVRTQLKNLQGINFYLRCGFVMKEYDLMFARIIRGRMKKKGKNI